MRHPSARSPAHPSLRATVRRIAIGGVCCALAVSLGGWVVQMAVLGWDGPAARARVERDVRGTFDQMARELRVLAGQAAPPALVREPAGADAATRRLFDAAESAMRAVPDSGAAFTLYSNEGVPRAWAGLPSDLPPGRLSTPEAWFLAEGSLGLRLFYVRSLESDGTPLGLAAAERPVAIVDESLADDTREPAGHFRVPTTLAPVAVQAPSDRTPAPAGALAFDVTDPTGRPLLRAHYFASDIESTRERWRVATSSLAILTLALTVLLIAVVVVGERPQRNGEWALIAGAAALFLLARAMVRLASPADWSSAAVFSGVSYASPLLAPLLTSPFDFLMTALAAASLVGLAVSVVESWRIRRRSVRHATTGGAARAWYLAVQSAAGLGAAGTIVAHEALLRDTIGHSTLDLLRFSLLHWDTARMALQVGLIVAHATALGVALLCFRAATVRFRVRRHDVPLRVLTLLAWVLPLLVWELLPAGGRGAPGAALLLPMAVAVIAAGTLPSLVTHFRHGSYAVRVMVLAVVAVAPTCAFYPALFRLAKTARLSLVETRYAPQAMSQRVTVQRQLEASLDQIDQLAGLERLVAGADPGVPDALTDRAFDVWQVTALSTYPATSSVELYAADGTLVGRFAFNLPEDLTATPLSEETRCEWGVYEEVAPFFGEERRIIHAGRALCDPATGRPVGSIVVHAMPDDYENLPFLTSRSPYVEILRPSSPLRGEGSTERGIEYAVYGWSGAPMYASGATAWSLPDDVFARIESGRGAFWAELQRGAERHDVYLLNDRGGIYALGVPIVPLFGHLLNLAEVTLLAVGATLLLVVVYLAFRACAGRTITAPALLRAVRSSFYRKLFLAFVAAVFIPVVLLAVATRNYVADRVRANIEQEAVRTAAAAGRVVANVVSPRGAQQGSRIDDNLLVFVSRLIDQDVNIFADGRLRATSERNLFASGFLPTRTPATIHRALELRRDAAAVSHERIGDLEYLVAATPLRTRQFTGLLTLPLPSRQQEIDTEIDTLDRRVLLAALLFIIAGAGLGYSMAERISDPVSRLSRATRRIARGDLNARTLATSSDELGRLVDDFNSMAAELHRQRVALERTHRIEAWAEMARQVAHEIKNPLTPIQLNAEHLRRVHADRGEPLGPVVQECVATILTQVKLLRQIASEFSSFASSPTARPAAVDVGALVGEVVAPYAGGLDGRIRFDVRIPDALPLAYVDRTLVARALTNLVENALHAMPAAGTLGIGARAEDGVVRIQVSDTGHGMDAEALSRAFEPYFSTKTSGTGLGLPLARRNVELNGGTIGITSERHRGTVVDVTLPVAQA